MALISVLYVDDEPDLLELSKTFLEMMGDFQVDLVTSGTEALSCLASSQYDAIVSDYQMPGMDGLEFLRQVRSRYGQVPFILFTGRGREEVVVEAINQGVDFYLQKGGDPQAQFAELALKIRQAVNRRRTEEELQRSETLYRTVFGTTGAATIIIGPDTTILLANTGWEKLTGVPRIEQEGKMSWTVFVNKDDVERMKQYHYLRRQDPSLAPTVYEARIINTDGSVRYCFVNVDMIPGTKNSVASLVDITERRKAEDELRAAYEQLTAAQEELKAQYDELRFSEQKVRESEEFLDTIVENIPNMIFIKEAAELRFVRFNRAGEELLGYLREDLQGKNDYDFFPKSEADFFTGRDREVLASGQLLDIQDETIQTRYKGERILHTKKIPIRDPAGNTRYLLGISEDITDRKRAEDALRENEKKFRDLFNNLNDAVYIHEIHKDASPGRLLEVNDIMCSRLGYSREELLTMSIADIISDTHRQRLTGIREHMAASGFFTFLAEHKRKDGSIIPVEINSHILTLFGKRIVLAVARDISERKRAEEALRESEQRYRIMVETANDGVWAINADFITTFTNRKMQEIIGYSAEEMLGHPVWDFVPAEEVDSMKQSLSERQTGKPGHYERRWIRKDGSVVWCLTSATPIFSTDGTFVGSFGMFTDITRRREMEVSLRESEEKYRTILENIQECFYRTDAAGRIILVSPSWAVILGYAAPEELYGRDMAETMYVNPEDRRQLLSMIEKTGSVQNYEVLLKKKDGTPVSVLTSSHKYYDARGTFLGIEGIFRDITERKQAEAEYRRIATEWQQTFDASANAIFILDRDQRVIRSNAAATRIFGFPESEMLGRACFEIVHHANHPVPGCPFIKARTSRKRESMQLLINGRWYDVSIHPFIDRDGHVSGGVHVVADITEHRLALDAIRKAHKKLALLAGITRHDILNQMTILQASLDMAKTLEPGPSWENQVMRVQEAADRILAMIQFTGEYEKIGVDSPVWQEMRRIVAGAVTQVQPKVLRVLNEIPDRYEIYADPLIGRVVVNLLENALRHGGTITEVRFSFKEQEGSGILVCEDDGVGIAGDEKEKIFERGYGKNTGMGLFLSREILSITGITIRETGLPGKGARFEMTVPKGAWRITRERE